MRRKGELEKKIDKYTELFGEGFPTHFFLGETNEELIKEIDKCIEKEEVYELEYDDELIF